MKIHSHFYDQKELAKPFFLLQKLIFPRLDLQWAHNHGVLPPSTVPFGIFHGVRALSILNATRMDFNIGGTTLKTLQFGTVATHPDFLRQGLAKRLMETAMDQYKDEVDLFFLYANENVLDFYPRFGFKPVNEPVFLFKIKDEPSPVKFRKLNVADIQDRQTIVERITTRTPISKTFCVQDYRHLAMWYCLTFYKDAVWYCDQLETLLVARKKDSDLIVYDVVADELDPAFFQILNWPQVKQAVLHFVPDRFKGDFTKEIESTDDQLLVKPKLPKKNLLIKIPHLAYT